ncbi:MAG: EAL domain-containing protein [Lachnospiraceae bacterium]|nr:EAL domain-containing protein [Lachnospiraceae bacterium]
MWDFSFVIPTLLVLIILFAFYFSLPRLPIRRNKVFVQIVIIEMLTVVTDILASIVDNAPQNYPLFIIHFLNAAYFVFFFIRFYLFFLFTEAFLNTDIKAGRLAGALSAVPAAAGVLAALLSPVTGWVYYFDDNGYNPGSCYKLIYAELLIYIVFSFAVLYRSGRFKRRRERCAVLLYNLMLLIGVIARGLFPRLLLLDTFCLMAILIIYLSIGNPEFYLDPSDIVFNGKAFRDIIEEKNGRYDHRLFGIVIHNYYEMRDIYGSHQIDEGVRMIAGFLVSAFPGNIVFYYRKGRFIILGDRRMDFEGMRGLISDRFTCAWKSGDAEIYLEPCFITMELGEELSSSDDIFSSLILGFKRADTRNERSAYSVTSSELAQINQEIAVKRALENAIENDSMEVYLQPLIDASTDRIAAAEALSRIKDRDGKLIPPGLFIPIAERSGRINELGEQVFEKTCRFIKENDIRSMGIGWINVNLSPAQFMRADLMDRFESILKQNGIDPESIHLEITEESMVDDSFLQKQIQTINDKGFKSVLDDYGTGYSNLTRLKKCPFTNIKLDMSLVWDYCASPDDILPSMIQAFKSMGFSITAEGIENESMADIMKKIGCDYLQGYYYSKPIPMDEFMIRYGNR